MKDGLTGKSQVKYQDKTRLKLIGFYSPDGSTCW